MNDLLLSKFETYLLDEDMDPVFGINDEKVKKQDLVEYNNEEYPPDFYTCL